MCEAGGGKQARKPLSGNLPQHWAGEPLPQCQRGRPLTLSPLHSEGRSGFEKLALTLVSGELWGSRCCLSEQDILKAGSRKQTMPVPDDFSRVHLFS